MLLRESEGVKEGSRFCLGQVLTNVLSTTNLGQCVDPSLFENYSSCIELFATKGWL